jgi:hypothetical protein
VGGGGEINRTLLLKKFDIHKKTARRKQRFINATTGGIYRWNFKGESESKRLIKIYFFNEYFVLKYLTLNLLTTTIVASPSNDSKWQMGFNSAFKGLIQYISNINP